MTLKKIQSELSDYVEEAELKKDARAFKSSSKYALLAGAADWGWHELINLNYWQTQAYVLGGICLPGLVISHKKLKENKKKTILGRLAHTWMWLMVEDATYWIIDLGYKLASGAIKELPKKVSDVIKDGWIKDYFPQLVIPYMGHVGDPSVGGFPGGYILGFGLVGTYLGLEWYKNRGEKKLEELSL